MYVAALNRRPGKSWKKTEIPTSQHRSESRSPSPFAEGVTEKFTFSDI